MPFKNSESIFMWTAFIIFFVTHSLLGQQNNNRGYHVSVGDSVPDFTLQLDNGNFVSITSLRGKVVILQFTASWCSVCRKEMPHLEKEVWQRFKDDQFLLIGVDYDEPIEKVLSFKKQMGITYPMALDPNAEIFARFAYKNQGVTRNVVIDQTGHIAYLTRLYDRKEFEGMVQKVAQLLHKQ